MSFGAHTRNRFFVRRFGSGLNFDSGTLERYHRDVVVAPFKVDARRELGQLGRLYEVNNERALLDSYKRSLDFNRTIDTSAALDGSSGPLRTYQSVVGEPGRIMRVLHEQHPQTARTILGVLRQGLGANIAHWTLEVGGESRVFSKYVLDYGVEKILFINAPHGYRRGDSRRDYVEVALDNEDPSPAEVVWYFTDFVKKKKVLCKWLRVQQRTHTLLRVPVCIQSPPTLASSYIVCDVESITGHAHIVRDYDSPNIYYWDIVNH